ncbi:phosphoribosylamine--glycine ligase [Candidatus Woesearchaeota archaeon]|nr:phosphoribosylamine--glycine ligase [Candidatus Woesearchaeota archaeon]
MPDKRKFLFVSWESLSGDIAWQVKKEGHEVKVFIKREEDADVYEGVLDRVDDWQKHVDWADVIVFDDTNFGEKADKLRKQGKFVVGGGTYTDKLEEDREFGQSEMRRVGMLTLPGFEFTNFDEAIKFVREHPERYVFKPSGVITSDEKGLLFIGEDEDGKDLLEVLAHNKKVWGKKITKFILQKFASGVEIAVGAFFNGSDFILPINVNFEHKRLFPGEIGPFTGEMGTLMYWSDPNTIFRMTLEKMKEPLAQSKYVGYVDINCIATSKGVYPLEFTCRFGYPTISIQMEGIQTPISEFLFKLAKGEPFQLKTKRGFQIGVVIAVPPYPFDDKKVFATYKDSSILFKKPTLDGFHLGDVKFADGDWHLAGESGYVLVITGSGSTVEEARKQSYSRIKNIILQNMMYRTDIGVRWYHDSDKLQTWGYLY